MSIALDIPTERMSIDQFIAWTERANPGRCELVDGKVMLTSPERARHWSVKQCIWLAFRDGIRALGLDAYAAADGPSIATGPRKMRQPDVIVQSKPGDWDSVFSDQPIIVVEVISPSTGKTDAVAKLEEYLSVETIQHYLIVDPDQRSIVHHAKSADGWHTHITHKGTLQLDPPGLSVDVDSFFEELN
ncbi:MAG: Uma2 family endonuclease [Pseudomonadota bacterium]